MTIETYGILREGYEKLKRDLKHLKRVERPKVLKEIERARAHGDISDNAEYEAAKHAQGLLQARIADFESKLARSRIVEEQKMDANTVLLGAVVRVKDLNRKKVLCYTIVSDVASDFKSGKISVSSPVGKGLLGAKVGQTVEIEAPAGKLKYQVLEISR